MYDSHRFVQKPKSPIDVSDRLTSYFYFNKSGFNHANKRFCRKFINYNNVHNYTNGISITSNSTFIKADLT